MQPIHGPDDFVAAFNAPAATIERLTLYEKLLRQWQKAVNLVAPSTLDDIWHRHFADSAQIVPLAPPDLRSWIDLGSGGGFPGLVAAILMAGDGGQAQSRPGADGRPTERAEPPAAAHSTPPPTSKERGPAPPIHFTLIESVVRKSVFLREVVRQTGLVQAGIAVDILSKRAESARVSVNESLPRVVSARALAPLDRLLELAAPYSAPGSTLLFLKGKEAEREVQLAESRWKFQVALVPSVTDRHGRIAVITNLERKAKD
ncbi:MAG TPA: 16S rRNA (guanine(527)-N(7))-methyltransferase RsmG [Hyphomicrobiaceae bacterium]|nr:16S rRNA (guanine(527)-N(7))-methyltransferase RsmG [Hyphomicrobiaceae bacterium]